MKAPSTEAARPADPSVGFPSGPVSNRPTAAVVDLGALSHNYRELKKRSGDRKVLAVVKAQAYGHGALPVARRLIDLGADMLGVALVEEGKELREAGIQAPVLLMGALFPEQADEIVRLRLVPVVQSLALVHALSDAALRRNSVVNVHVKVDTGMGRIGLGPDDVPEFIDAVTRLGGIRVEGLMTHFADADLRDKAFASVQMDHFEGLVKALEGRGISVPLRHAANSAAVLDYQRALFTMVRPGLMLYGYDPLEGGSSGADLQPVLSLITRIAFLKRVPAGTPISYGRTFVTKRESRIATIPVGYADGYSRGLSNTGEAIVRGLRAPVAGRVCMDMTMLDVTDVPDVKEDDEVVLIGSQDGESVTADEIARKTGTIPYEVLCGIGARVPRVYI